jgi:hypothetical protein
MEESSIGQGVLPSRMAGPGMLSFVAFWMGPLGPAPRKHLHPSRLDKRLIR